MTSDSKSIVIDHPDKSVSFTPNDILFTTSAQLSHINATTTIGTTNHEIFLLVNNAIRNAVETIYKYSLKHIYHTRRTSSNLLTTLDCKELTNRAVQLTTFFRPPPTTDNTTRVDEILAEMLTCAIEILLIERHLPTVNYEHDENIGDIYSIALNEKSPTIYYRQHSLIELVNNIEAVLFELYEIDPDIVIDVAITNNLIRLLPLPPKPRNHLHRESDTPDIYEGIVCNGRQTKDRSVFLIKIRGSNKDVHLEKASNKQIDTLLRKGKYWDSITFSAFPIFKTLRGNTTRTNRLRLHKILSDRDPGQMPFSFTDN